MRIVLDALAARRTSLLAPVRPVRSARCSAFGLCARSALRGLVAAAAGTLLLAGSGTARAQSGGTASGPPGPLGLGVIVGSPTGLSAKWRATRANSFDAGVGIGFGNSLHLHADWLFEGGDLMKESGATLGWFAGVGGKFAVRDHDDRGRGNDPDDDDDDDDDDVDLGPRVPVGLDLAFANVPNLELFAEIALGLEIADDQGLFLDGGIGARWFF